MKEVRLLLQACKAPKDLAEQIVVALLPFISNSTCACNGAYSCSELLGAQKAITALFCRSMDVKYSDLSLPQSPLSHGYPGMLALVSCGEQRALSCLSNSASPWVPKS